MKRFLAAILGILLFCSAASAQGKYVKIYGVVNDVEAATPLPYATVVLSPSGQYTLTDEKGNYSFDRVSPGHITVKVEFYGKISQKREIDIPAGGKDCKLDFNMEDESFRMQEVVVTATRSEAGASTSSIISRQAMDHMATSSLSDVMSLIPGVQVSNPNLTSPNVLTIRAGFGGSSAGHQMNSLGTAVVVDGAPLSNNANLQALAPAMSGSASAVTSSITPATTGVDVRTISTDNIESVEVIRGIPSVQYGDLTAGAVLVKSKAGASPLNIHFKTNPKEYQVSVAKGFQTAKAGAFNISADYAYSNSSLTAAYEHYRRANAKLFWSKTFGGLSTNTSISLNYGNDKLGQNPDLEILSTRFGARTLGTRLTTNGHLNLSNAGWLKSIDYNFSGAYTDKWSFREEMADNAMNLYTTAMTSGSIISTVAGGRVYDVNGNEITNYLGDDANASAKYMPYSYTSYYDIYGKEVNAYGKVMANFFAKFGDNIDNGIIAGADFRVDGNLGKGLVFPDGLPPYRNITNVQSGFRTRPYYDIPFVNQLGVFLQDDFAVAFGKRIFNLSAGVRYDNINGMQALSPRVNASFDIVPHIFTVRGGWGITSKAPTVLYMYPFNAYCDLTLYNNTGTSARIDGQTVNIKPEETLTIAKTLVYDVSNKNLEIAQNRKAEIGFDLKLADRYLLAVTAYDEAVDNGYTMGRDLSSFNWMKVYPYKAVSGGIGTGTQPVLALSEDPSYFIFEYYKPLNTSVLHNRGVEFELDLGRFPAIRTSFYINGAYTQTKGTSNGYSFTKNLNTATTNVGYDNNIAVWEPGRETYCGERILTTFRATHNIPDIGFVITMMLQVSWMEKDWTEYKHEDVWSKYISWEDGKVYDFDPALKDTPEFSYMNVIVTDAARLVEKTKPYAYVNLNITKEIGQMLTATFYVNNITNYRPLSESNVNTGTFSELGLPLFFGFDLKLTIK